MKISMKKFLLVGIFFLLSSLFVNVYAQESTSSAQANENSTQSNYFLPYPGLLPDNPFYFLRAIRDKIVSLLIVDPRKKITFDLLQADKRLNASTYLMNEHPPKEQLAETTVSKAENYFSEAISMSQDARKQGIKVNDIWKTLLLSAQKHKQVIQSLEKETSGTVRESLKHEESRVDVFEKTALANIEK